MTHIREVRPRTAFVACTVLVELPSQLKPKGREREASFLGLVICYKFETSERLYRHCTLVTLLLCYVVFHYLQHTKL